MERLQKFHLISRKLAKVKFFAGMVLFGLLIGAIGVFLAVQPKTEKVETTATIFRITESYDDFSETTEYEVVIKYEVEGQIYYSNNGSYHTGLKEGDTQTIYYDPANPENISTAGSEIIPYIMAAVGAILLIIGLVKVVMALKTSAIEDNPLNRVNMANVTEEEKQAIIDSDEEEKEYYYHFTQQLKQGYILETPNRQPIYEAVSLKLALFTKYQFNFINHVTGHQETKEVTHTVSHSYGDGNFEMTTDSGFKINGVNCWEALGQMGYSITPFFEGITFSFDICKYGVPVAHLKQGGANVATGKNYKLGNIPTNGVFVVNCRDSDLDGVFLACFCISRTYN